MKNKLLITTALVALVSANNAFAQMSLPDLSVTDNQELTESTGVSYNTINVTKEGTLTLTGADIKTSAKDTPTTDITVNGTLNLKDGSVLEAGSDIDGLANNSNILLDGATVTMNDSDLEANGNIIIKDTNLSSTSSTEAPDNYGIWAEGNINVENSNINLEKSYIDSFGDITIDGGVINMANMEINSWRGNLNVNGGEINFKGDEDSETLLYARKELNINGGVINMGGAKPIIDNIADSEPDDYPAYDLNINGGTINVTGKQAEISSSKNVNINGGTINIAEGSTLGIYGGNDQTPTTSQLGSAAILNIAGTLDTSLNGNGTINFNSNSGKITGDVNMTSGGVLNVGLNKATIGGDITFDAGSTLKMSVTDEGNGSLQAANITGKEGSKLALTVSKTMEIDDTETVKLFETAGKLDNNFTNEISNNRYKITSIDGGTYNIKYENSASDVVADAGGSVNNASTAEAWDSMVKSGSANAQAKAVADVLNDLSQNNEQAYVAALTAVAPEVAPMVQKTQTETANQVFGAVGTRLTGGSISTGSEGMSSGDSNPDAAVWVQGMYNHSKLDDTSDSYGFDADSSGVAMGIEKFVTDDVKVGAGYAYTNTDIDGFMRSTDVDTHTAILYGEYKPSNWYINGIATYGWSDYSEDKNVNGQNVNADYDVETFGLQAMTGYDMQVKNFGLTPEVGLRYVHIKQDAYKDSANQDVSGNDSDILTGVIGAKVNKTFALDNGMLIKPEARIAATYDLFNDDVNSVVTLANGSAYAVEGEALDRFGMEFGAGITAEVNDNVELSLGYEGKFREDYQDHTGLINLKYKF